MWPAPVSPARKVNSYLTQVYIRLCVQSIHLYECMVRCVEVISMTMCDRLRAARLDADVEQKELARLLGITQQQYSLYETGRRRLPAEMLAPLCRALGVSADYLLGLPRGLSWPR